MSTDHDFERQQIRLTEFAALQTALSSHKDFPLFRGQLGGDFLGLIDECLSQKSRSATMRWLKVKTEMMREMLKLLAEFRHSKQTLAEMELLRALTDRNYVLPGETFPKKEIAPYTVFMVDPEVTLAMHRFFQDWRRAIPNESNHGISPPEFWKSYRNEAFCADRYGTVLRSLLRQIAWDRVDDPIDSGNPLYGGADPQRILTQVVKVFGHRIANFETERVGQRTTEFSPWGFPLNGFGETEATRLIGNLRTFSNASCMFANQIAQDTVLGAIDPNAQRRIASWEFQLPPAIMGDRRLYAKACVICLLPETDHQYWLKVRPQFTSRGVAHGYCAVFIPIEFMDRVFAAEDINRLLLFKNT